MKQRSTSKMMTWASHKPSGMHRQQLLEYMVIIACAILMGKPYTFPATEAAGHGGGGGYPTREFLAVAYDRKAWIGEVVQSYSTHVVISFKKNCKLKRWNRPSISDRLSVPREDILCRLRPPVSSYQQLETI